MAGCCYSGRLSFLTNILKLVKLSNHSKKKKKRTPVFVSSLSYIGNLTNLISHRALSISLIPPIFVTDTEVTVTCNGFWIYAGIFSPEQRENTGHLLLSKSVKSDNGRPSFSGEATKAKIKQNVIRISRP